MHIRFFAESNEFIKHREIYRVLDKANNSGYLNTVNNALLDYDKTKSTILFETAYNEIKAFSFDEFDNQQNTVIEYKSAHNELISGFESALNAISNDKSYDLVKAINSIYDSLTKIIGFIDTIKSIHSLQNSLYTELVKPDNLYSTFKVSIPTENRVYSPGINFNLSLIFGTDINSGFIDDSDLVGLPNQTNSLTLE